MAIGKPDLVVAKSRLRHRFRISQYSSSGLIAAGFLAAKVDFHNSTNPHSVAIGDLNGMASPIWW